MNQESTSPYVAANRLDLAGNGRPLRIALYSHDAMGVGHVRRNQLIAQALSQQPTGATSLLICGIHEATAFCAGHGVDCLTVPSLEKHDNEDYRPRDLNLSSDCVAAIRSATLESALVAYQPDILIVDKIPPGLQGELLSVIPLLRKNGTKIVFGMREILDTPEHIAAEWGRKNYEQFLLDHYDAIWIYGDPAIFDPIETYQLHSLTPLAHYTGYFDQRERLKFAGGNQLRLPNEICLDRPTTLCMLGGGQDGESIAEAFAKCSLPNGSQAIIVTGPLMQHQGRDRIEELVRAQPNMYLVNSLPDADQLMPHVDRVVCMGGYNSMLSVVSFEKPALIVPRTTPRQEQLIRAQRFQQHDLVDYLHPDQLSPQAITQWLASDPVHAKPNRSKIDLDGLRRLPNLVSQLTNLHKKNGATKRTIPGIAAQC